MKNVFDACSTDSLRPAPPSFVHPTKWSAAAVVRSLFTAPFELRETSHGKQ
jgi:hypothetical protein